MSALLRGLGADVIYHDPHVAVIPGHDVACSSFTDCLDGIDCAVIVTAHGDVDHSEVAQRAPVLVDLRGTTGRRAIQHQR